MGSTSHLVLSSASLLISHHQVIALLKDLFTLPERRCTMDPLSALGAALGVTSLIIQLTDECVKGRTDDSKRQIYFNLFLVGYKFYHAAANFPETHRYLLVRLQIEQQRFHKFAIEAGILQNEGAIYSVLRVNRSLLLAILAEIKILFEKYAAANGKYEPLPPTALDSTDFTGQDTELTNLLPISQNDAVNPRTNSNIRKRTEAKRLAHGIGKGLVQTAQNLRTIVLEPKRLVWAALDKTSFEEFVSQIESLNSFLIALLDSAQFQRLQDSMNTTYMEILQLRNDVGDLTGLVAALTPSTDSAQHYFSKNLGLEHNSLSQTVEEETKIQEKRKSYLKHLAKIKIHFTQANKQKDNAQNASNFGSYISPPLSLGEFEFDEGDVNLQSIKQRMRTTFNGRKVWIEWKENPDVSFSPRSSDDQVQWRIGLLATLLHAAKPDGFRAAPCLGYVKVENILNNSIFGLVFEEPGTYGAHSGIIDLRQLLEQKPIPSLSVRMGLCAVLSRCMYSLHSVNWLHKAFRSDNILFFASEIPDLKAPFVSGFELSRPSMMDQWTEKPKHEPSKDIYRHPSAQASHSDGTYRRSYDMYSLGIVFIEIATWKRIETVLGLQNLSETKPSALIGIKSWLQGDLTQESPALPPMPAETESCLQQVASACGDSVRIAVERCLSMDALERPEYIGEPETDIALRLQRLTEMHIVKKLEQIAKVV
jgi:hypothetical protein